jgi:4-hydroxy-2-oxoheptanedioate aldolase
MLRSSRILRRIGQKQMSTLAKINLADARSVEIAGAAGVDAVWLCMEHVPNDWLNLENMIRAARLHDIDALVRVSRGSYSDYIKPLEAGAAGIIVPHVSNAEEAREIMTWTRFLPLGRRALDGGNIDGAFTAIKTEDYIRHCNEQQLVVLQIESPEALEEVEAIAAVSGCSGLFFGPNDFAHLIGKPGQTNLPEVLAARQKVARAAVAAGKFSITQNIASRDTLAAQGHHVVAIGADVVALKDYFQSKLAAFNA